METIDSTEDFLSLSLAVSNHSNRVENKLKRKRKEVVNTVVVVSPGKDYEGRITRLLNERSRMLNSNHKGKGPTQEGSGLHLIHLLLVSATLINESNASAAVENLTELYSAVMSRPSAVEELMGFAHLYRVSPFYQFAHFTANQIILEAFEKEEGKNNGSLHVIDYDISHGFQWPSMIQSLSEKATVANRSLSFTLTGIGKSIEELIDTEKRLVSFSTEFSNVKFKFLGVLKGSKIKNSLQRKGNETVAVNLVFHLSSLNDIVEISNTLTGIHSVNPSIVVLAEREGSRNNCGVLSSYVDALHYYAAMFDSLDDCLPLDSPERLAIERNHLGREIKEAIALDEVNCSRFETLETWKGRMERHGFTSTELSSKVSIQAKLLLKMGSHYHPRFEGADGGGSGGFRVYERDEMKAVSLGWQDRVLVTASSWRPK